MAATTTTTTTKTTTTTTTAALGSSFNTQNILHVSAVNLNPSLVTTIKILSIAIKLVVIMDKRYYWKYELKSQSFSFPVYFIVKQYQLEIKYIKINQLVYLLCSTWCTKGRFWANNSVWCSVWLTYCNKREVELRLSLSTVSKCLSHYPWSV